MKRIDALRSTVLLAIASSVMLAGCALKNPPFGADIMPESARAKIPGSWAGPHRTGAVVPNWIRAFGDAELTALVADAVERNPDLKAAAARVEASRAAVRIAASSLYPRIAMKGLGERQGQRLSGDIGRGINPPDFGSSGVENSGGAGLDTSVDETSQRWVYGIAAGAAWEADVWGRIRSKKAAAKAESGALEADYEFARQSLAAAVARAYFSTIEASQQEANAQETLDLYQEYSKLTDVRKQQGFASDFDVSQIRSRTASAQEALYTAQQARAQTIRGIATRDDLDRADCLRPCLLRGVECLLRAGRARPDLRNIKVAREPLLFAHVGELRILLVEIESFLGVGFLLRRLDGGEVRARHGSGEGLPRKFVVGFQRAAFSFCGGFFRANASPHICLPCGAGGYAIYPAL